MVGRRNVVRVITACSVIIGFTCIASLHLASAAPPPICVGICPPPPPCNQDEGPQTLSGYTLQQSTSFDSTDWADNFASNWFNWGGSSGSDSKDSATDPYGWFNSNELDPTKYALYLNNADSTSHTYEADIRGTETSEPSIDTEGIGSATVSQAYGAYDWCQEVTNNDDGLSGISPTPSRTLDTDALLWPSTQDIESVSVSGTTATATMPSPDGFTNSSYIDIATGPYASTTEYQIATTSSTTFTFTTSVGSCTSECGTIMPWPPEIDLSESSGMNSSYSMTIHFFDTSGSAEQAIATPTSSSFPNSEDWNEFQARWTPTSVALFENGSNVAEVLDGDGTDLPIGCVPNSTDSPCYKLYCYTLDNSSVGSTCVPATPMAFDFEQGAFEGTSTDSSQLTGIGWISQFSPD